jgi:hypothetical protein
MTAPDLSDAAAITCDYCQVYKSRKACRCGDPTTGDLLNPDGTERGAPPATAPDLPAADLDRLLEQRDAAMDWADRLAYAIAPVSVIGEHTSLNDPWQNALDLIAAAQSPAAVERAARAIAARRWYGVKPWAELTGRMRAECEDDARAALAAAWGTT